MRENINTDKKRTINSEKGLLQQLRKNWDRLLLLVAALALCLPGQMLRAATFTKSMLTPRQDHTATLMQDGDVLVAGGYFGNSSTATSSAELYSPAKGLFYNISAGVFMANSIAGHTATLLPNGKILIAGGKQKSSGIPVTTAQLYDPTTRKFTATGAMIGARYEHTATLLNNGLVLIAGGRDSAGAPMNTTELYDFATNTFTSGPNMNSARAKHAAVRLPNGDVMVSGGIGLPGTPGTGLATAEIYNGTAFNLTTGNMPIDLWAHSATLLNDGKVLVAGGVYNGMMGMPSSVANIFDPAFGNFTSVSGLIASVAMHTATLLTNGQVMIAGGVGFSAPTNQIQVYNPVSRTFQLLSTTSLATSVRSHTATLLPSGRVLFAGGATGPQGLYSQTNLATVVDTRVASVTETVSLSSARFGFTATTLPDETILIAGGTFNNMSALNTAEIYNPGMGSSTPVGPMNSKRHGHTAILLNNGKVLLAGGYDGIAESKTAELYDVSAKTFTPTFGNMSTGRYFHTATMIPGGKVLITGGQNAANTALNTTTIYDPATNTFNGSNNMTSARSNHTATLLKDGKVFVAGGYTSLPPVPAISNTTEIFDPKTAVFTATMGNMTTARAKHTATLMHDGRVLLAGGESSPGFPTNTAKVFDPLVNNWNILASMYSINTARYSHTATLLPDGRVLLAGGSNGSPLTNIDIFDPENIFAPTAAPSMLYPRANSASALLQDGRVLLIGGENSISSATPTIEIFNPNADISIVPPDARRPVISSVIFPASPQPKFNLVGTGFTGLGEGSGGGVNSSSTAYPVVQMQKLDSGETDYINSDPLAPWSDNSVTSSSNFDPSPNLVGYHRVTVFANGIPSLSSIVLAAPSLSPLSPFFSQTDVGTTSAPLSVTLINSGTLPLTLASAAVGGTDAAMFLPSPGGSCGGLPVTLPTGGSCTLDHVFSPTASGVRTAYVQVLSDDPANPSMNIPLQGTGAYPINLTIAGGGASNSVLFSSSGTSCFTNCTQSVVSGTVTLTPTATAPYTFSSWTGCDSVSGNDCIVNMTALKNVTATFAVNYPLALTFSGTGSGDVLFTPGTTCTANCSQTYASGSTVTLTPTPLSTSTFFGWSGCDSVSGNICSVTMLSARSVTPTFNLATTPMILGDVNGDGKIDVADALMTLQIAVGLVSPSSNQFKAADVAPLVAGVPTPDAKVNTGDAVVILRRAAGLTSW
jgi:hypothetical protein